MRILTINAGSSSVKFSVFDTETDTQLFQSQFERVSSVEDAIRQIPDLLRAQNITALDAIGHRVAHGGTKLFRSERITADVIHEIETCVALAPLHNPSAITGINIAMKTWADLPQVAVFDTAFHRRIPDFASTYAVPQEWRDLGLRRYGFHGTSHHYIMRRVAEKLETPAKDLRIVSCHLGNGASICAIENGVSVDTSMGMTPLEGLVMGTRSGDIDPGAFAFLNRHLGLTVQEIEHKLYNQSGLAALSGLGNDMRDIEKAAEKGDKNAQLAINVYAYRVRKYIGAYAAAMGGVDVIAFTGGLGENSVLMRQRICERLEYLGVIFDDDKNTGINLKNFNVAAIHHENSRVRVFVTRTREDWMMAQEVRRVLAKNDKTALSQMNIPIAVSGHHVHLTQDSVETLFGKGYQLKVRNNLSQPGFWAAEETVDMSIPHGGMIKNMRILGPCRPANQIEITETESYELGLHVPVRLSGDTADTPVVTLHGPAGSLSTNGLIVAKRHIHMNAKDAELHGLKQGDQVEVRLDNGERDLIFSDVIIRTDPHFVNEMHIDTDEANAAHIEHNGIGELIICTNTTAHICEKEDHENS